MVVINSKKFIVLQSVNLTDGMIIGTMGVMHRLNGVSANNVLKIILNNTKKESV